MARAHRAAWKTKRSPQRNTRQRASYYEHRTLRAAPEPVVERPACYDSELVLPPPLSEVEEHLALLDYQAQLYGETA